MVVTFLSLGIAKHNFTDLKYSDFVLSLRYASTLIALSSFSISTSYPKFLIQKVNKNSGDRATNIDNSAIFLLLLGILVTLIIGIIIKSFYSNLFIEKASCWFFIAYSFYSLICGYIYAKYKARKNLLMASLSTIVLRSLTALAILLLFNNLIYMGIAFSVLSLMMVFKIVLSIKLSFDWHLIRYSMKRSIADFILPGMLTLPVFIYKMDNDVNSAVNLSLVIMLMGGIIALLSPLSEVIYIKLLDLVKGPNRMVKFSSKIIFVSIGAVFLLLFIPENFLELINLKKNFFYYYGVILTFFYSFIYLAMPFLDASHDGQKFLKLGLVAFISEIILIAIFSTLNSESILLAQLLSFVLFFGLVFFNINFSSKLKGTS